MRLKIIPHMPRETLQRNLTQLHKELETADTLDDQTRESLAQLAEDIQRVLADESADHRSLAERIETTALEFEASHPRLSRLFGEVTDALAKIGI